MSKINETDPNKSPFGWKMIVSSIITGAVFLAIIYWAIHNEPDYMPSQQKKAAAEAAASAPSTMGDMAGMDHSNMSAEDMAKMDHGNMSEASMAAHEGH